MYHLILLLPRLLTNNHHLGWFKGSNLLLTRDDLITPMSCVDRMGSGYVSQTSHRVCFLTLTSFFTSRCANSGMLADTHR
jgi:hypothetical protein